MWDEAADEEVKLERIITQEAYRPSPMVRKHGLSGVVQGILALIPSASSISNYGVVKSDGHKDGVRCWPYPPAEFNLNKENVQAAINQYKKGSNNANVNVW